MSKQAIENISDTARWVAIYRAMETERPDAHFKDPYARMLAGEHGEEIVRTMPYGKSSAWVMIVRTCVFDELILKAIKHYGADTVVNLAAGLDTRPYRLDLPSSLRWIEIDLPQMIEYKESKLLGQKPRCVLARYKLDLSDVLARRELFSRINRESRKALIITEGLLIYLPEEQVAGLADDLHGQPGFRWWLTDLTSPALMKMLQRRWDKQLKAGHSEFKFAVKDSSEYFGRHGWKIDEERSPMVESFRLNRTMPFAWLWRVFGVFMSKKKKEMYRKYSSFTLFERAS